MNSILRYIGRLNNINLAKCLKDIDIYVEPFSGSFNCGFNTISAGYNNSSILNDKDELIYIFWKTLRQNPHNVYYVTKRYYEKYKNSESFNQDIKELLATNNEYDKVAYVYLYSISNNILWNKSKVEFRNSLRDFKEAADLLKNTTILNKDAIDILKEYDSKSTFFMIDPPYLVKNVNSYYRNNPSEFDHVGLHNQIMKLQGNWILRYKVSDYITELYKDAKVLCIVDKNVGKHKYKEIYYTNSDNLDESIFICRGKLG